ncbi:MAG TPA: Holliday junction resolvase RuvX [Pyrinomonadaceae bacterium]
MSNSKTTKTADAPPTETAKPGRLLALDLGHRRVGLAVTDELRITIRPLPALRRANWKQLVRALAALVRDFDAQSLVIGLPLSLDGAENSAAQEVKRQARNLELSLGLPVFLQDERLTSHEAEGELRAAGYNPEQVRELVDSAAAALILRDYLARP